VNRELLALLAAPLVMCRPKLRSLSHISVTMIEVRRPVMALACNNSRDQPHEVDADSLSLRGTERLRRDSICTGSPNVLGNTKGLPSTAKAPGPLPSGTAFTHTTSPSPKSCTG
jgi:hypothetical protein